jgi:hypothetical protein
VNTDIYTITAARDGWRVELNGDLLAIFKERGQAERAAAAAIRISERRGRSSEVVSEGAYGDEDEDEEGLRRRALGR